MDLSTLQNEKRFGALKELLLKIKELEKDSKQMTAIVSAIPRGECHKEDCFLNARWDFFVLYLVNNFKDSHDGGMCERLMIHLNDCFRCMERFSEVIRDYHRQYLKFR